ncbi:hypothetical protein J3Q64DRAFT_1828410 [Phycomyces blakesleeanus]|uniref:Uncharacterized protein n=2 Tax=Phycomyces blakesleeanus TaxID=4837 RepID=A0A167JQY5_PHYB8|nr:hypothetical protein PHYBLDRAFT_175076 [Phycomyces blakesleeanus NRRL 1555(-)]OAD66527.1 hypothetical protein PHYBLDRAFT_175076 [Phycomyces blakesleeanus NRRL 1555(-)]|eukprot:XP_018284567.1 hypothetical protein PHYBLDRAFT_175076 [Phycomyces blakesleeanus NRRL 1555(-)]
MSDTLDMSTASLVSQQSELDIDDSVIHSNHSSFQQSYSPPSQPTSPLSVLPVSQYTINTARLEQLAAMDGSVSLESLPPAPVAAPLPIPTAPSSAWPTWRTVLSAIVDFIFRDNNLPLLINLIYHLAAARVLIGSPTKTSKRYLVTFRTIVEPSKTLATDAFRMIGVMHLAFGLLAGLALKERKVASERSALLVLALVSTGQAWAHGRAYAAQSRQYTFKALQEIGLLDAVIVMVSSVAWTKTVRRTGRVF